MNNGGKREGAGRKSKAEEQQLIEKLSPMEPLVHDKLREAIAEGRDWGIKLYFAYMYGAPKTQTDLTSKGERISNISVEIVCSED